MTTEKTDAQTIAELKAVILGLREMLHDVDMDNRTKRTHLRDEVRLVQNTGYNLLTEDIIEPLSRVITALDREKPLVDVAIHFVTSAIEKSVASLPVFNDKTSTR